MKISKLGEFGLIDRITKHFSTALSPGVVGIGDDCAVIPQDGNSSRLITTDMLIEDTHFLKSVISPKDVGHKSLAVNLSDIAAMGGLPCHAFLSLGLPADLEVDWIDDFIEGFGALAHEYGVQLLGGDTTRSPGPIIISVTVVGTANTDQIKLRSSAQPGDFICVTGFLGDSGGGLKSILDNHTMNPDVSYLQRQHFHPQPHVHQGEWLGRRAEVRAMMDVSDGINSDLKRIMDQSKCGSEILLEQLPISPALHCVSTKAGWDEYEIALSGGEDYCLLLTVQPQFYDQLAQDYKKEFQTTLFPIGTITEQSRNLTYRKQNLPYYLKEQGFEHFPQSSVKT